MLIYIIFAESLLLFIQYNRNLTIFESSFENNKISISSCILQIKFILKEFLGMIYVSKNYLVKFQRFFFKKNKNKG